MGYRRDAFAPDEWFHCYTRSVDSSDVFGDAADAERFLQAFHLANSSEPIRRSDLFKPAHEDILTIARKDPLVSLGAYNLMPTHFHLLLKARYENGISKVMQTVGTAFSMYYNLKHKRIGNVFVRPFRAKHIANDEYLKNVTNYIHLNHAELYEPRWKDGLVRDKTELEHKLRAYRFSSLPDHLGIDRVERNLLDPEALEFIAGLQEQNLTNLIDETSAFYLEYGADF